jgi:predicted CopG family antitoxin
MSNKDNTTTTKIKHSTWKRLHERKQPGDSFDDVINRVLNKAEKAEKSACSPE